MEELIKNMERQLKNQLEETKKVKEKILKSLEEEMTTENLNRAAILLERETRKANDLISKLAVMYELQKNK